MGRPRFLSADAAVDLIADGAALTVEGSGGGLLEPNLLLEALGRRFRRTGRPHGLTLVHCTGIGDRAGGGLDHLAEPGLLRRVIAGNWGMAPAMSRMALEGAFEAYNFPQGTMAQLYRDVAAHRPGVITKVGLDTFCDPRVEGGRLNDATSEELVEVLTLDGEEYLRYRPFDIDVAFIRATTVDEHGNLSLEQEGAILESLAVAQATRNAGGTVIAQVQRVAAGGTLPARDVVVPGVLVDVVVVNPDQWQTVEHRYEPAFSGELRVPVQDAADMPMSPRKVVARRAATELHSGAIVNLGVGAGDGVASVLAEEGCLGEVTMTVEQGLVGGMPARGLVFGVAYNPTAVLDQPAQFDFYDGGGLDIAFLGFAEIDRSGNVNVSKFNGRLVGTGGFVNITSNVPTVVFCGTFSAGGLRAEIDDGRLRIADEGKYTKFVSDVEQITFAGRRALERGQRVRYVTERAVFELTGDGLELIEVAPGVDVDTDVLKHIPFTVRADNVAEMDASIFRPGPMGLRLSAGTPVTRAKDAT